MNTRFYVVLCVRVCDYSKKYLKSRKKVMEDLKNLCRLQIRRALPGVICKIEFLASNEPNFGVCVNFVCHSLNKKVDFSIDLH